MAEERKAFDPLYIGVIRVGQASGMLEQCLDGLVRLRRRQYLLRQRVRSALAYPSVVASVGVLVVIFLMTFVVPKIVGVLRQTGRTLPVPTKILLAVSNAVVWYWWVPLTIAGGVFIAFRFLDRRRQLSRWLRRRVLRVPLLGPLLMKVGIARSAGMLETMLRSGLPLDEALVILRNTIRNDLLQEEYGRMLEALRSGRPMVEVSGADGVLPPAVVHMLSVGEQTGQLEEMLAELATFYDEEVEVASRRAVAMLEPALIVVLSCVIGFIVLATILPILRLSGSL